MSGDTVTTSRIDELHTDDEQSPTLPKIAFPGAHRTTVQVGDTTLHFSYETLVAVENERTGLIVKHGPRAGVTWSSTTAKHLNTITRVYTTRTGNTGQLVSPAEFAHIVAEVI